jgi:hypothetical protein
MTNEDKAVAIFELRMRGMHPEWIRWFTWFEDGHYLGWFMKEGGPFKGTYEYPPTEQLRALMRDKGYVDADH